jgi:hypothetical protein
MRKWLIRLACLGSILVVTLFTLEFALSKFAPHYRTLHKFTGMNSHGFRDKERTYEKEEGVFRILVLGDSMTRGVQVPLEQSYPYILEAMLNSGNGEKFEVINLGVSRFDTAQEYLMFRSYGIKYQPDLVILAFFNGDDVEDNSLVLEKALVDVNGGGIDNELKYIYMLSNGKVGEKVFEVGVNGSARREIKRDEDGLLQIMKQASARLFPNVYYSLVDLIRKTPWMYGFVSQLCGREDKPQKALDPISYEVYTKEYSSKLQKEWDITKSLIMKLANELRVSGTDFLVVIIPAEFEFIPDKWNKVLHKHPGMKAIDFDVRKPERILTGFLEASGIGYLLLRPEFEEYGRRTAKELYLKEEGEIHWNSNGHALAAQVIYRKLKEDYRLIPGAAYTTFEGKLCASENSYENSYPSLLGSDCLQPEETR